MKKKKTWIIAGASRGFGLEISKAILASRENVVATVRSKPEGLAAKLDHHPKLHAAILDINDAAQAIKVAAETVEKLGSIDVLANNAGFGPLGGVEEISDQEAPRVQRTDNY
jgi:NAD(P)-dependent dehydrogenase (short-subunit alcohol dehydrogenase family)